jgi:hypothetical protein
MDQRVTEILKQIIYPRRETALSWILAGNTVSLSYYRPTMKRNEFRELNRKLCRSQWPRGLGYSSAASRPLRLWVWILPRAWMFVCFECCLLSGRGPCDELITRPEEFYRVWCVVVCDLETSWMRRPWPIGRGGGSIAPKTNKQTGKVNWNNLKETSD